MAAPLDLRFLLSAADRSQLPATGAEVAIPPGKAVRFKPGKELQALQ